MQCHMKTNKKVIQLKPLITGTYDSSLLIKIKFFAFNNCAMENFKIDNFDGKILQYFNIFLN